MRNRLFRLRYLLNDSNLSSLSGVATEASAAADQAIQTALQVEEAEDSAVQLEDAGDGDAESVFEYSSAST